MIPKVSRPTLEDKDSMVFDNLDKDYTDEYRMDELLSTKMNSMAQNDDSFRVRSTFHNGTIMNLDDIADLHSSKDQ